MNEFSAYLLHDCSEYELYLVAWRKVLSLNVRVFQQTVCWLVSWDSGVIKEKKSLSAAGKHRTNSEHEDTWNVGVTLTWWESFSAKNFYVIIYDIVFFVRRQKKRCHESESESECAAIHKILHLPKLIIKEVILKAFI